MTTGKKLVRLERSITQAAIILYLVDDFTGDAVTGQVKVSLKDYKIKPRRNPSGYYVFTDLASGDYQYAIESDGFEKFENTVTLLEDQIPENAILINLVPLPSYPFPAGVTLIRGTVFEKENQEPIKDVSVELKLKGKEVTAKTSDEGQFVFYLPRLKQAMWKKVNGRPLVKADDDTPNLTPKFTKNGYQDGQLLLITEGTETVAEAGAFTVEVGKTVILKKYLKTGGP